MNTMKKRKKNRRESGQAIVEFAIVLPLFMLLVMGIIDFGWLFYNYISVENSARNAARIACVEYTDSAYDEERNMPLFNRVYTPDIYKNPEDRHTDQEKDVAKAVDNTLPKSVTNVQITVEYTYDDSMRGDFTDYDVYNRSQGDVTVTVTGKMKVLTPVLGVFSDNMQRDISSTSTFKVERQAKAED